MPRIFITGASGFIGSHVIAELLTNKDNTIIAGLVRSEASEKSLKDAGVNTVLRGSVDDSPEQLTNVVKEAKPDAIIHLAFNHEMKDYPKDCETDKKVIKALGAGIAGTSAPFIVTSGGLAQDEDEYNGSNPIPRIASEAATEALAKDDNANAVVVRLPQVHDQEKQGLITFFIPQFQSKGVAAYIEGSTNRLAACYIKDAAHLYVLALEKALSEPKPGVVTRYHASAEDGHTTKAIAEAIGVRLGVPVKAITQEEVPEYYGPMAIFTGLDLSFPSTKTQERLQWNPQGPTLLQSIKKEY